MTTTPMPAATTFAIPGVDALKLHARHYAHQVSNNVGARSRGPRACLILVHGFGEHGGRYGHVIGPLQRRGYEVMAYDQRGFGRSPGRRGHIDSWSQYRGDLRAVIAAMHGRRPETPLFLYGHSLGALVVLDLALREPEGLAGVIVSGAPLWPVGVAKPHRIALAHALSRIWPTYSLRLGIDPHALTRDPKARRARGNDPLLGCKATVRWGTESLRIIRRVRERAARFGRPLLMLHGDADRVNHVAGAERFFAEAGAPEKQLIVYPGGYHELHNDEEQDRVVADVGRWIDQRLDASQTSAHRPGRPHLRPRRRAATPHARRSAAIQPRPFRPATR